MENHTSLEWFFEKKKFILKNVQEVILELVEEKHSKASFTFNGTSYTIRNQGFWNPITVIENELRQIAILKRSFLGSKATIEFDKGNTFVCKVSNSPLVKLSFYSEDQKEILNYKLQGSFNPNSIQSILEILPNTVDESEFMLLIVLGFLSFKGIATENSNADLIIITAGA